jgi:hypothetical protein
MELQMRVGIIGLMLLLGACSSSGNGGAESSEGGQSSSNQGGTNSEQGGKGSGASGGDASAGDATVGATGGEGGAPEMVQRVELPKGSREIDGIVNLIDADAAQDVEDFLAPGDGGLTGALNLFLTYYEERYDFVFLFTARAVPQGYAAGRFTSVTSLPRVGTGATSQYLAEGYRTNGRIKGTMAVAYGSGPFSHEIEHYWGVFLDRSFGFGVGKAYNSSVHWGYAGVDGVLGGFDPKMFACQTPAGAKPPNCTALPNGRVQYVVRSFNPGANGKPYAPIELYLMGLAPAAEVPPEIPVLQDAEDVPNSFDSQTGTEIVEAAGVKTVTMADITARHGVVSELPEKERHFTSAFVVVSAAPASDEVMAEVALRAAAFGDRGQHPITKSFAADTGGRATMDTVLGPRRAVSDALPPPRAAFTCDVITQDCDDDLACYGKYCGLPGKAAVGEECSLSTDCGAGATCVYLGNADGRCAEYCDAQEAQSPLFCASMCSSIVNLLDADGKVEATVCRPD